MNLPDTSYYPAGGQMPKAGPQPSTVNPGYPLNGGSGPSIPNPQDSASLPMFNPTTGYSDGVNSTGDLGGVAGL